MGLRVGLAVGVCVVVLSVLASLAVGIGRLFGRAWARSAAPLLSFGAAGITLCALLAGFFVLGVTAPLDRLLLLGRPGPHALALLLGSLLWPSFAVLGVFISPAAGGSVPDTSAQADCSPRSFTC